tara:strand:+ start:948 stop:1229 length:282 start_codon:yes stop_codon:yes gene_type:complete
LTRLITGLVKNAAGTSTQMQAKNQRKMSLLCAATAILLWDKKGETMNCWHCETKLIWGGDHDLESEEYLIETNLSCPKCNSFVLVYYPKEKNE